jgi:hypothetical protein
MGQRSDPAGSLHEMMGVSRIATLEDKLDAAEHLPGTPGIFHPAALYLYFDPKVAFYSCNRVNGNSRTHVDSSLSEFG